MSTDKTGGSAFPTHFDGAKPIDHGMTLRDYFASKAPAASDSWVATQSGLDKAKNPYNDDYKPRLRSELEIRASYAYKWADAMIAERAK